MLIPASEPFGHPGLRYSHDLLGNLLSFLFLLVPRFADSAFRLNQAFVQELLYSPVAEGLLQFQDRGDPGRHRLCGRCNGRLRAGFRASYPACLPISHAANLSGESISEISSFLSAVPPV
jgi:hypothetical protein